MGAAETPERPWICQSSSVVFSDALLSRLALCAPAHSPTTPDSWISVGRVARLETGTAETRSIASRNLDAGWECMKLTTASSRSPPS